MRITFLITNAFGSGGTIRTTLTMAAALAERHDVEVVSVVRHRAEPMLPMDPRIKLRVLVDDAPAARRRRRATRNPVARVRGLAHRALKRVPSRLAHPRDVRYAMFSVRTDLALIRFLRTLGEGDVVIGTRPSLNLILARYAPSGVVAVGQEHMNLTRHSDEIKESFARLYPRLDAVVALTEGDAERYRVLLGPGSGARIRSMPNAVPDTHGARAALDDDTKVVVAAGRLVRQKGFDRLIGAWGSVAKKHPDWRLDIFGHGDAAPLQARIDKKKVAGSVTLRGFTPEPHQRFAESSIYVMSSRGEGFPMVLLEAMAIGLPLVSFDCQTGPAEMIKDGHNGLLVPDGDLKGLAAALNRLIEDPQLRRRMGAAGVEEVRQYTPDRIAARWETLFEELRAAPRRRTGRLRRDVRPAASDPVTV